MLDAQSRWKSNKTYYFPGIKEWVSCWLFGVWTAQRGLAGGKGHGGGWKGLASFCVMACEDLQLLARLGWDDVLMASTSGLASATPVERLGWWGWRSREGSIQAWVWAAAGCPELSLHGSSVGLEASREEGRERSVNALMPPEHSEGTTEIVGQLLAALSITFIVCLNAFPQSRSPNLLFKVSAVGLLQKLTKMAFIGHHRFICKGRGWNPKRRIWSIDLRLLEDWSVTWLLVLSRILRFQGKVDNACLCPRDSSCHMICRPAPERQHGQSLCWGVHGESWLQSVWDVPARESCSQELVLVVALGLHKSCTPWGRDICMAWDLILGASWRRWQEWVRCSPVPTRWPWGCRVERTILWRSRVSPGHVDSG